MCARTLGEMFHASFWGSAPGYLIPLKGGVCSPVAKSYQVMVMKPRLRTRTLQGEPMRSGLVSYQEAGRLLECSLRTSVCPSRVNYSFCNNLLKPLWFQSCGIITFSMLSARLDNCFWGRDCMSCVWQSLCAGDKAGADGSSVSVLGWKTGHNTEKKVVTTILRRYEVPFRIDCKNFPWTLCMHLREPWRQTCVFFYYWWCFSETQQLSGLIKVFRWVNYVCNESNNRDRGCWWTRSSPPKLWPSWNPSSSGTDPLHLKDFLQAFSVGRWDLAGWVCPPQPGWDEVLGFPADASVHFRRPCLFCEPRYPFKDSFNGYFLFQLIMWVERFASLTDFWAQ